MEQPARLSSRDDIEEQTGVAERSIAEHALGDRDARGRGEREELEARLRAANERISSLEHKLKQTLTHLITAEGVRAERDRLRAEIADLRRGLGGVGGGEDDRQAARTRSGGTDAESTPGQRVTEALSQLVKAETIRTERERLRTRLAEVEGENEHLRAEVARLRQVAAPRRRWLSRPD